MFSRRKFILSGAATTTAVTLLPRMALAATMADVTIVGGGLSGMNAALLLRDQGFKVVVLEAGDIVGGRVKTVDTVEGPTALISTADLSRFRAVRTSAEATEDTVRIDAATARALQVETGERLRVKL